MITFEEWFNKKYTKKGLDVSADTKLAMIAAWAGGHRCAKESMEQDSVEFDVQSIVDKYGKWERYMKGGTWQMRRVISKRSYDKMIKELEVYIGEK